MLQPLVLLHALHNLEGELTWLLTEGLVDMAFAKAVPVHIRWAGTRQRGAWQDMLSSPPFASQALLRSGHASTMHLLSSRLNLRPTAQGAVPGAGRQQPEAGGQLWHRRPPAGRAHRRRLGQLQRQGQPRGAHWARLCLRHLVCQRF